ncbi:MAG: class I SAM-dependent methyltransferase [Candidatus Zixiibacteriota bacterium]
MAMGNILRTNAIPVYGFLSYLKYHEDDFGKLQGKRILDCGAGGSLPPVTIFAQAGCEAFGIDNNPEQLALAKSYCDEHGVSVNLHQGDMRAIPFEDESFDIVYEHFAMCHLSKNDNRKSLGEMMRVLKSGGICFAGFISKNTWPIVGEEINPGEFAAEEHGARALHSFFSDAEAAEMVADWLILKKEIITRWDTAHWVSVSRADWQKIYEENSAACSPSEWSEMYDDRTTKACYSHIYFILQK